MKREGIPAPREGVIVTHFLVVRDQETSREWYREVFGAEVVNERDPLMLKFQVLRPSAPTIEFTMGLG
jgi:lactoylglutathione lyase